MPRLALLLDNDVLLKAAHWDLLDVLPGLVGCKWPDMACLPQFPPRVARVEAQLFADPSVAHALSARLAFCCELPAPDVGVIAALQSLPNIDAGELLLTGALAATPGALLLTGDKRAVTALSASPVARDCRERFICTEQLLWSALDVLGALEVTRRVRRWSFRDVTARIVVGTEIDKSADELRDGLISYIHALDCDAPGMLIRKFGL